MMNVIIPSQSVTIPSQQVSIPDYPTGGNGSPPMYFRTESEIDGYALITDGGTTSWWRCYQLSLGSLAAGDILHWNAEGEMRNDNSFNVESVQQILLSASQPVQSLDLASGDVQLARPNGHNVDAGEHYVNFSKGGSFKITTAMPTAYVTVRTRARSSTPGSGNVLFIVPGTGFLSVLVFK
jgi:hypothetical protein